VASWEEGFEEMSGSGMSGTASNLREGEYFRDNRIAMLDCLHFLALKRQ